MPSLRTRSFLFWDFSSMEGRRPAARACSTGGCPATTSTGRGTVAGWRWGGSNENSWETLCDILGCAELKGKHIVYGAEARPVKERLAASFASRTQHEWSEVFARADCCVSPILTVDEALENEQLRARRMAIVREGLTQLAPPVKIGRASCRE